MAIQTFEPRDRVEELTKLASNCSVIGGDDGDSVLKVNALYGHNASFLATTLVQRALFLENQPILYRIVRDSWQIYSYIHSKQLQDTGHTDDIEMIGLFSESLIKLTKSQPMKSYLRLSFRQVMSFILSRSSSPYQVDMPYLLSYINEIRASYNTLCFDDRQILRPPSRLVFSDTFAQDAYEDASFLIGWNAIEAAKYCICHKFAPEMPANDFLSLLRRELLSPTSLGDKVSRRFLIEFLQNIDKFIQDRIQRSSTGKHTFSGSNNIEQFYKVNCSIFQSWYLRNRQCISRLSLIVDDPAECWRNTNLKLCLDLATKFQGLNTPSRDPSFSQTLMSLNTKNWYSNISLIVLSAKQLHNLPLLYGIKALASLRGLICDYPPLEAIISNLKGSYEQTYNSMKDSKSLDEQSLIEFLDSCIELNLFKENSHFIDRLKSDRTKLLYLKYLESKTGNDIAPKSRLEEVDHWLNTWSELNVKESVPSPVEPLSDGVIDVQQSIKSYIDLIVPACLNIIARAPQDERPGLVEHTERLVSQDFIAQCLFPPSYINKNIKVYHVLLELLKGMQPMISENLVKQHSDDLHWNHVLYRHLCDLNLIDTLRNNQNELVDLIQFKAAKYHWRHNNASRASKIAEDLSRNAFACDIKLLSSLSLVKEKVSEPNQIYDHLHKIAADIDASNLDEIQRCDLISKVLRRVLRQSIDREASEMRLYDIVGKNEVQPAGSNDLQQQWQQEEVQDGVADLMKRWRSLLDSSSLTSKLRTLLLFSRRANEQLQMLPNNDKILNSTFELDLKLLKLLGQSDFQKHKASGLECATRIMKQIVANHLRLNENNLKQFSDVSFLSSTTNIWISIRSNLISVLTYQVSLSAYWRDALVNVVKFITQNRPNLLIYSIIVNRLDLQNELNCLKGIDSSFSPQVLPELILRDNSEQADAPLESNKLLKIINCQRKLTLWNDLFDHIKSSTQFRNRSNDVIAETERFLKEIRKISFLCSEYFKLLTIRIPKRLYGFLEYLAKNCDTQTGKVLSAKRQEDCEQKLKIVCERALEPIRLLLNYGKRIGESHLTKYDIWFCETFSKQLHELEYRLSLLAKKRPLIQSELEKLVKSVTELLAVCRNTLLEYNHNNRQKLYMELISPMLSRLEPSSIPMPDCCVPLLNRSDRSFVTIHKISQTVNLIVSKTSPKKLKFTGSDGISRCFLLKAHEDLRLDQLIMDLFASINSLLLGDKSTQNKFRIRKYSVTPVSSRSGLIQWIEAPSLCSSYRAWLNGPNGRKLIEEVYSATCDALCENQDPSVPVTSHTHCQPSLNVPAADLFYQLLWAKTKPTKKPITQTKPCFGNIVKYRAEFDSSYFQNVVEQLIDRAPNKLISNQLWYKSTNSHSYWLKTKEFIHSYATMSIVGYVIGLGDRHPENILLDYNTGEVIHIDYNVCFEFGKTLPIPETVPFRLTQNIIQAFGFAGLEGGFTLSCRDVLNVLKQSRSTLLHLLDPVNLEFMIQREMPKSLDDNPETTSALNSPGRFANASTIRMVTSNTSASNKVVTKQFENMDMCSQELSVELNPNNSDVSDLLILHNNSPPSTMIGNNGTRNQPAMRPDLVDRAATNQGCFTQEPHLSFDLQYNIKTPAKIMAKSATNIHERIRDKLSGADECVRHYKYKQDCKQKQVKLLLDASPGTSPAKFNEQTIDLIMLNDAQTTEDQVDALIIEATSIKNKAVIFEGWLAWV